MQFRLLGTLAVFDGGAEISVPPGKQRALLALLLLHAPDAVPADRLVDALWGEDLPRNPTNALQARVSQLRKALGPAGRATVVQAGTGYAAAVDDDDLDVHRFERLTAEGARLLAASRHAQAAEILREALSLWHGEALGEFVDEPWATGSLTRLTELRLAALEDLIEAELELGQHAALTGKLEELVHQHPLRERLRAQLMLALYRAGRQTDALEVYEAGRRTLSEELGLDPGPQLRELHASILSQDSDLDGVVRPNHPTTNLPAPTTPMVGAKDALQQVTSLARAARLVTLTGPGGVGKTRTAIESARQLLPDHPGGVWLVELASLREGNDILPAIARAVGAVAGPSGLGSGSGDPLSALTSALAHQQVLVVLDNAEHLVDDVAAIASTLLGRAAALRLLVTSREALGVRGEVVWSLPSLPVPPEGTTDAAKAARYASVELFAERARAAASSFALDDATAAAAVEIVRALDGIPLALELAAARLRVMSAAELSERLGDRFRVLSHGGRDALPRQRTLRGLLDWSWDLLGEDERRAWVTLATFAGDFTLADAEALLDGVDDDPVEIASALVDRSLVSADTSSAPTRYRMLETVREYGRARRAESDGIASVLDRHRRWLVQAVENASRTDAARWSVDVPRQAALLADARDVMARAAEHGKHATVARIAGAMGWTWWLRGLREEGLRWLTTGLTAGVADARAAMWAGFLSLDSPAAIEGEAWARAGAESDDDLQRGLGETFLALHLARQGNVNEMVDALARARARLTGSSGWPLAATLLVEGAVAAAAARSAEAEASCREASALFNRAGAWWGELFSGDILATVAEVRGDYDDARLHLCRLLSLSRQNAAAETEASSLARLGNLDVLAGDYEAAARHHGEALSLSERIGSTAVEAFTRNGIGLAARRRGDLGLAEDEHARALTLYEQLASPAGMAVALAGLGFVSELRGDKERARAHHLRGLSIAEPFGDPRAIALGFEGLAGASVLSGRADTAVALLVAAAALRAGVGTPLPAAERDDVDRIADAARRALGEEGFDRMWASTKPLTPSEAVALVTTP